MQELKNDLKMVVMEDNSRYNLYNNRRIKKEKINNRARIKEYTEVLSVVLKMKSLKEFKNKKRKELKVRDEYIGDKYAVSRLFMYYQNLLSGAKSLHIVNNKINEDRLLSLNYNTLSNSSVKVMLRWLEINGFDDLPRDDVGIKERCIKEYGCIATIEEVSEHKKKAYKKYEKLIDENKLFELVKKCDDCLLHGKICSIISNAVNSSDIDNTDNRSAISNTAK